MRISRVVLSLGLSLISVATMAADPPRQPEPKPLRLLQIEDMLTPNYVCGHVVGVLAYEATGALPGAIKLQDQTFLTRMFFLGPFATDADARAEAVRIIKDGVSAQVGTPIGGSGGFVVPKTTHYPTHLIGKVITGRGCVSG